MHQLRPTQPTGRFVSLLVGWLSGVCAPQRYTSARRGCQFDGYLMGFGWSLVVGTDTNQIVENLGLLAVLAKVNY